MFAHENQTPVPLNSHLTYAEAAHRATLKVKVKVQAEVEGLTSQVEAQVQVKKKTSIASLGR